MYVYMYTNCSSTCMHMYTILPLEMFMATSIRESTCKKHLYMYMYTCTLYMYVYVYSIYMYTYTHVHCTCTCMCTVVYMYMYMTCVTMYNKHVHIV